MFFPGYREYDREQKELKAVKSDDDRKRLQTIKRLPPTYPRKVRNMCAMNSSSLEINYGDLGEMQSLLAIWLTDIPKEMLSIFDEVLKEEVLRMFPYYEKISRDLHVRVARLPIEDRIRDLRQKDLNNLIKVAGVVTKRSGVFPEMKKCVFNCGACGLEMGPFVPGVHPGNCTQCQETKNFKMNAHKSEYGNYQSLTLQESPGSVPAGRVPRHKEIVLLGDLIDVVRPGEEIEVTGVYMHRQHNVWSRDKSGFPVFFTIIEANHIQKRHGTANSGLTDEDKRRIRQLGADPRIRERIIKSIAPSIYGIDHVKSAIALALFGGCAKDGGNHRVRGDINVLLLGDPGTAKSQILKYAEKTAPRAIYTTGKGASAVGLTAGVHRDPQTKEWTLEGGALVLADQGVCLIDEFDKMSEQDRTSIHEAMEQQTISISKAGIVTSLQARCAVLAAANPIGGRYDPSYNFSENVELTDPILSRFDILCVLQDVVDPVTDEQLALFVTNSHMKSHPDGDKTSEGEPAEPTSPVRGKKRDFAEALQGAGEDEDYIDQELLKKYISYSRAYVKPILHDVDTEKVASLYADLRKQSALSGGVPIAVRHIESVMRMSEASARMHLRDHVRDDDVDFAIKIMLDSFLQAQKVSVQRQLKNSFRKYTSIGDESNQLLFHILQGLVRDHERYLAAKKENASDRIEIPMMDLERKAKELNIYDLRRFYDSEVFLRHSFEKDLARRTIVKMYL